MRFFYQTRQWHLSNMWALCRPQIRIPLKYLIRYYKSFAMILSVLIFRSRCVTRLVLTVLRPWKCPRRNVRSCVREQSPRWRLSPVPGQRRAGAQYWLSTRNININTRTTSLCRGQWKVSTASLQQSWLMASFRSRVWEQTQVCPDIIHGINLWPN